MGSNRYEREIEEILRNTHVDDARPSVSERIRALNRRQSQRTRQPVRLGSEVGLLSGILLAFGAATLEWIAQPNSHDVLVATICGALATAGFVIIVVTLVLGWQRAVRGVTPTWRGQQLGGGRGPGPRPFASARTRWNLFKLRLRYRRDR